MTLSEIFIRTPLTCKLDSGLCQVCYGWNLATGKIVELGESVGILAAQSIGEPGTQLTMRTFHTGGVFSGEAKATILAPFTGKIWYDLKNDGKKIYTKYKEKAFLANENKKIVLYQNNINKSIMYLPRNSIVFAKPGKIIFDKQIIAELPEEKKNKNDLNLDFIKVKSKFPGQIHIENKKNKFNKKVFWILSANVFNYNTFFVRLINKYRIKNINVYLIKKEVSCAKKVTNKTKKLSSINVSLKNLLSVSKKNLKKTMNRNIKIRLIIEKEEVILTSKPSRERVIKCLNSNLKLGNFFKANKILGTFNNFYPSQIIQKRKNAVLIRKVSSPYGEKTSLLNLNTSPFVIKDVPLAYTTYKQQKAKDIVQGLPKVEQLFEARKNIADSFYENLHEKLATEFNFFQKNYPNKVAVRKSIYKIQDYLLIGVQDIYESQGVNISDKHVEIIIKQMTSKVMITCSGNSSFMIGDIVNLNLIESINETVAKKIVYEPVIIGITRLSLSSQSFIAAASFQETTKVLITSALQGKVDWLYGLKENLVLGNLIPAGTGFNKTN